MNILLYVAVVLIWGTTWIELPFKAIMQHPLSQFYGVLLFQPYYFGLFYYFQENYSELL